MLVAPNVPELMRERQPGQAAQRSGDQPGEHHDAIGADAAVARQVAVGRRGPHRLAQARVAHQRVDREHHDDAQHR